MFFAEEAPLFEGISLFSLKLSLKSKNSREQKRLRIKFYIHVESLVFSTEKFLVHSRGGHYRWAPLFEGNFTFFS